jgi:hypothetical protein
MRVDEYLSIARTSGITLIIGLPLWYQLVNRNNYSHLDIWSDIAFYGIQASIIIVIASILISYFRNKSLRWAVWSTMLAIPLWFFASMSFAIGVIR